MEAKKYKIGRLYWYLTALTLEVLNAFSSRIWPYNLFLFIAYPYWYSRNTCLLFFKVGGTQTLEPNKIYKRIIEREFNYEQMEARNVRDWQFGAGGVVSKWYLTIRCLKRVWRKPKELWWNLNAGCSHLPTRFPLALSAL